MGENTQNKKKSNKLVLVAVFNCGYFDSGSCRRILLDITQPNCRETGSRYLNFRVGAWANYSATTYNANGTVAAQGSLMAYSYLDTFNGAESWVYIENDTSTYENGTVVSEVITFNLNETTYSTLHTKEQVFINGEVI